MNFIEKLQARWQTTQSMLCVGLDPDLQRLPPSLAHEHACDKDRLMAFSQSIIDSTADLVCAFKPQIAHYAALRMEDVLEQTIRYIRDKHPQIPVVLDAKRADIGSTAERYASEAFERYQADAVTINPYLGYDSAEPFLRYTDRGIIVLCRTSNAGSAEFQTLAVNDGATTLYEQVAIQVSEQWNSHGNCALVVGATYPEELANVRRLVGSMPILVPGVGAQGGDIATVLKVGTTTDGYGLIINSSRGILYAGNGADFASKARAAAEQVQSACAAHILKQSI